MADIAAVLLQPGVGLMTAAALMAGFGAGYAGFGAALVFLPIALAFLAPVDAVAAFSVMGLSTLLTLLPGSLRAADRGMLGIFLASAALALPVGVFVLVQLGAWPMRMTICVLGAATLVALSMGLSFAVPDTAKGRVALGALSGLCWGATGLVSPVLAILKLRYRTAPPAARAGIAAALPLLNLLMAALLWSVDGASLESWLLGLFLTPVFAAATLAGRLSFRSAPRRLMQGIALAGVAGALVFGMPPLS